MLMLGIAKKQTTDVPQFMKAHLDFSRSYYGEDSDGRIQAFFSLVQDLRHNVAMDLPYDQALRFHDEYLHALDLLEGRFPWSADPGGINLQTTWFNHLTKKISQGKWKSGGGPKSDSTVMSSIPFEKTCVVYNIGALTALQANQSEENKVAIQHFQRAAAIFHIVRDQLLPQVSGAMTCDLSASGMNLCSSICLAYAQKRFYEQATREGLPATLLAKLANQVAEFFNAAVTCAKQMEGAISPEYLQQFTSMTGMFRAYSEFHQATAQRVTCEKEMAGFGSCVRRYKMALEAASLIKMAFGERPEGSEVNTLIHNIQQGMHQIESDNDNVYMEAVPPATSLPAIGKVATVKVQPNLTLSDIEVEGTEVSKYEDLIDGLLPAEVHENLQDYHIRVESLVSSIDDDLRARTKEIEDTMYEYNLPFCLDAASGVEFPEKLWDKILEVQTRGGVAALEMQVNGVWNADTATRNLIQEIRKLLVEEEDADNEVRQKFRGKWTRMPSSNTNHMFFTHLEQTETQLRPAQEALPRFSSNVQDLQAVATMLDKTQSEIEQSLPEPANIPQDSSQVLGVRSAVDNLLKEATKAQGVADKCKAEILAFTIESHLIHAHQNRYCMDTVVDEKMKELDSHKDTASGSLGKLQNFIGSLRSAFERFQQTQKGMENPRVKTLSDLDNKAQTVLQTFSDIQDRVNYYHRVQGYLQNLQKQVGEYVFARNQEKSSLLSTITQQIANPNLGFQAQSFQATAPQPTRTNESTDLVDSDFQGVVIEEFPLGPLGIKILYEEGRGWKVTEVNAGGAVAAKGPHSQLTPGAVVICIDDFDLRNESNISSVLENPRGKTRTIVFLPTVAPSAPMGDGMPSAPPLF